MHLWLRIPSAILYLSVFLSICRSKKKRLLKEFFDIIFIVTDWQTKELALLFRSNRLGQTLTGYEALIRKKRNGKDDIGSLSSEIMFSRAKCNKLPPVDPGRFQLPRRSFHSLATAQPANSITSPRAHSKRL